MKYMILVLALLIGCGEPTPCIHKHSIGQVVQYVGNGPTGQIVNAYCFGRTAYYDLRVTTPYDVFMKNFVQEFEVEIK